MIDCKLFAAGGTTTDGVVVGVELGVDVGVLVGVVVGVEVGVEVDEVEVAAVRKL